MHAGRGIAEESSLGDFDIDSPDRITDQIADALEDPAGKVATAQLGRGDVDGDPDGRAAEAAPKATVCCRRLGVVAAA
jgi:hypothetical protein